MSRFLVDLARHPERCPVSIEKIDFAVPFHYGIGPRFETFEEAAAEARLHIGATFYPGSVRGTCCPDDDPQAHPKRIFWVDDEEGRTIGKIHFHRAFVHTRLVARWAKDAACGVGTDTVIATEEIFVDSDVRKAMTEEAILAPRGHVPSIRHREAMGAVRKPQPNAT